MTINEILKSIIEILKKEKIEEPVLKAKILVSYVMKQGKEYLVIHGEEKLNNEQEKRINECLQKLVDGEPIQYITNTQEFMGLDFFVDESVLIPQPDTETLVEEVIEIAKDINNVKILDLCTGSGAIAISIATNIQAEQIVASDISASALNIAKTNSKKNGLDNIEFIESNLFDNIKGKFNIIVSNPPYIETEEIKTLSIEVQKEPKLALDGGQDGLDFYRRIINKADIFLKTDGYLCLEIGYNQKEKVIRLIENSNRYKNIYCKKDLAGNDRIVICQKE